MAEINYIRHEANKKDNSYSQIAKKMGRDAVNAKIKTTEFAHLV